MADTSASLTRTDIAAVARLLGLSPGEQYESVSIFSTTVNGRHEEPATLDRAYLQIQDYQEDEEFDAEDHTDLFTFGEDGDYEGTPIEVYDPAADRETAQDIVNYLTTRFAL